MNNNNGNVEKYNLRISNVIDFIDIVIKILTFAGIPIVGICAFFSKELVFLLWLVPVVLLMIIVYIIIRKPRNIFYMIMNWFAIDLPFHIKERISTYKYVSKNEMTYDSRLLIKPRQAYVEYIPIRYVWSGVNNENLKIEPVVEKEYEECNIIQNSHQEHGYSRYRIELMHPKSKKDDDFRVGTKIQKMHDTKNEARPFFSSAVNIVTKKLVLQVILPKDLKPKNVLFTEYIHATDDYHFHRRQGTFRNADNEYWKIKWDIKKPIYGGKYLITWNF